MSVEFVEEKKFSEKDEEGNFQPFLF